MTTHTSEHLALRTWRAEKARLVAERTMLLHKVAAIEELIIQASATIAAARGEGT